MSNASQTFKCYKALQVQDRNPMLASRVQKVKGIEEVLDARVKKQANQNSSI